MKKSDLSKLVREAALCRWENLDRASDDFDTLWQRAAIYFPAHVGLGDENLAELAFYVEKSAFEGMTYEEIQTFIIEQFPEHEWGRVYWQSDGNLLHIFMDEAKAYADTFNTKLNVLKSTKFKNSPNLQENQPL